MTHDGRQLLRRRHLDYYKDQHVMLSIIPRVKICLERRIGQVQPAVSGIDKFARLLIQVS